MIDYNIELGCWRLHNVKFSFYLFSNAAHIVPEYSPFHFYSATKHAVKALTEGLRQELRNINSLSKEVIRNHFFVESSNGFYERKMLSAQGEVSCLEVR